MRIDAVLPWVDGGDPAHKAKRARWGDAKALQHDDVGGDIRFSSIGEIYWCAVSLQLYAPFIDTLYIVTDNQDPKVGEFLDAMFPEGHIKVEVVDHTVIFRGYEQYLPVFNSRAIESVIWRIPGLSENFLLLNDDFVLCAPVTPEDFFDSEGNPYCYARKFSTLWAKLLRALKPVKDGHKPVTFKSSLLNASSIVGDGPVILYLAHTPRPLLKSFLQEYFDEHPDVILRNVRHRFRDGEQYNTQEIEYLSLLRAGRCHVRNPRKYALYLQPKPKEGYVAGKMAKLEARDSSVKFICFNGLENGTAQDKKLVLDWIHNNLGIEV